MGQLDFWILGPVEAWRNNKIIELGGPKQRTVLAGLLLRANEPVSTDQLSAWLWGEQPPVTAATQIHKYVSQLRSVFGHDLIARHSLCYQLRLGSARLDLAVFDESVTGARELLARNAIAEAAEELRVGLALWRGPALADCTGDLRSAEAPHLEERRLAALIKRIDADLELGRHSELVAEVRLLVDTYPLQEGFRRQLMVCLYRAERTADALAIYQEGRELLAEELGLDPGPGLSQVHQAILTNEPSLSAPRAPADPHIVVALSPAQLPPAIGDFTGRDDHVSDMCALLTGGAAVPGAIVVSAVAGKAGIGKTTLAVHVAHRIAESFPDGQLYVDLNGNAAVALDPLQALRRFLRALGVFGGAIPDTLDECAELYRSRLAGKRILVLLDNAAGEKQVRPLLPGSATCAVLVTSRIRLVGLESARIIDLDVFEEAQAMQLLERIIGRSRVAAEPGMASEIVRLCGHLPLAVRVAAARLARRPHWRLAMLADRLADEHRRLDELITGDLEVRACLALTYQGLNEQARQGFRLLGLLEVPDFAAWVVGPLLGISVGEAEDLVEALVDAQFLDVSAFDDTGTPRFHYHDLIRLYAREQAEKNDAERARLAALRRAFGGWLSVATEAWKNTHKPGWGGWSPLDAAAGSYYAGIEPADLGEALTDPLRWFTAERSALVAVIMQACALGLDTVAWPLAYQLAGYLDLRSQHDDWARINDRTTAVCRQAGNRLGEAAILISTARLTTLRGDLDIALRSADEALRLLDDLAHPTLRAEALIARGSALREVGDHAGALDSVTAALSLVNIEPNPFAEITAFREIGIIRCEEGRWQESEQHFQKSLDLAREGGRRREQAAALRHLGLVHRECGNLAAARRLSEEAKALFADLGDRPYEAITMMTLGLLYLHSGHPDARRLVDDGSALLGQLNIDFGAAETLCVQAQFDLADKRNGRAISKLTRASSLLQDKRVLHTKGTVLRLLGSAYLADGQAEAAIVAWREAGEVYRQLGNRPAERDIELLVSAATCRVSGAVAERKATGTAES
jgi:DNA-binding SARP family transcriptional activator